MMAEKQTSSRASPKKHGGTEEESVERKGENGPIRLTYKQLELELEHQRPERLFHNPLKPAFSSPYSGGGGDISPDPAPAPAPP